MKLLGGILHDFRGLEFAKLSIANRLIILLPLFLFFNHNPHISLGRGEYETHYEINLLLIYLVIVAVWHIPLLLKNIVRLLKSPDVLLVILFGLYNTISVLWSPEPLRGLLTSAMIWLLIAIFLIFLATGNLKKLSRPLLSVYIYSAAVMSLFALYQMLAGSFPETKDFTLLCPGCQSTQFGFPRPNGFSVEPQFFGSLLVVPLIFLFHKILSNQAPRRYLLMFFLVSSVLFLTLSRGAIYSFIVASLVVILLDYNLIKHSWRPILIFSASLVAALLIQGASAVINPSISDTFGGSITKSLDQLTLGKLNLGKKPSETPPQETQEFPDKKSQAKPAAFQGYIEASTNERVSNTCKSLSIWSESINRQLFGVGVGGTGYYFYHPIKEEKIWCKTNL